MAGEGGEGGGEECIARSCSGKLRRHIYCNFDAQRRRPSNVISYMPRRSYGEAILPDSDDLFFTAVGSAGR